LQMFKLRSKVEVADSSEQLSVCALLGNAPVDHAIPLTVPSSALLIHSAEQMGSRIEILLDQEWQLAAEASWHISEIEAGIPLIVPESRELFTAQQVNLDLIGGVSFRKGCYPGQEVVARLHYL
ncbi:MAG TPA: folate-binding protein YgfZ, partial [Methylophaga sp.]|nr:folate-binding protein YgfZ [Methylophaga sp.]